MTNGKELEFDRWELLTYFPKVGLYDLHAVCVSLYSPLSTFECLNQYL
jgi:hypothetical protein